MSVPMSATYMMKTPAVVPVLVDTYIIALEKLFELLLAEFLAFPFELGLEGSNPLVMVVVRAHSCHVVGILIPENT